MPLDIKLFLKSAKVDSCFTDRRSRSVLEFGVGSTIDDATEHDVKLSSYIYGNDLEHRFILRALSAFQTARARLTLDVELTPKQLFQLAGDNLNDPELSKYIGEKALKALANGK
jgi:hypothetical protein